jgi:YD repeat-containing protein
MNGNDLMASSTDPLGRDTVYNFGDQFLDDQSQDLSRDYYSGHQGSSGIIKHIAHTYDSAFGPSATLFNGARSSGYSVQKSEAITIDGVVTSQTATDYDKAFIATAPSCIVAPTPICDESTAAQVLSSLGLPTSEMVKDGSGNQLQTKSTNWMWITNPAFADANLLDAVSSETISDGSTTVETDYTYDESGYGVPSGHLGHLTTTKHVNNIGGDVYTHTAWTTLGMVDHVVDGRGTTSAAYGYDSNGIFPVTDTSVIGTTHFTYDLNTGAVLTRTDPNGQTFNYSYDQMGRLWHVRNPDVADGDSQVYCYPEHYSGWKYQALTTPLSLPGDSSQCPSNSGVLVQGVLVDGLGRTKQTQLLDPEGTDYSDTTYDQIGQVQSTSNAYRAKNDSAYGVTGYQYDEIGRLKVQTQPDGTSSQHWTYSGNVTNFIDEVGNSWQRTNDALGRLTKVVEPNGAVTDYHYDVTGLRSLIQSGLPGEAQRTRSFTYDLLGRLITATNPETGTVCYGIWNGANCLNGYDGNGNLKTKTDARGVVTSYSYDLANQLTAKTYSTNEPSSCYQYGNSAPFAGRLIAEWTQNGSCSSVLPGSFLTMRKILSYDPLGRIKSEQQCHLALCDLPYNPRVSFDLAGNQVGYSPGVGQVSFGYGYSAAGRLKTTTASFMDASHPGMIFSGSSFTPSGALQKFTLGSDVNVTRVYDKRSRPTGEQVQKP